MFVNLAVSPRKPLNGAGKRLPQQRGRQLFDVGPISSIHERDGTEKHTHRVIKDGLWIDQFLAFWLLADRLPCEREARTCRAEDSQRAAAQTAHIASGRSSRSSAS